MQGEGRGGGGPSKKKGITLKSSLGLASARFHVLTSIKAVPHAHFEKPTLVVHTPDTIPTTAFVPVASVQRKQSSGYIAEFLSWDGKCRPAVFAR